MGWYLNPTEITKHEFVEQHAQKVSYYGQRLNDIPEDKVLLCMLFNGGFEALGVGVNDAELKQWALSAPEDRRRRDYYLIDKKLVAPLLPANTFK